MKALSKLGSPSALLLRLALAFAFLYAGIGSLRSPLSWESFLPTILTTHFSGDVLIKFFGVYELALAVWLLAGWYVRYAAVLCALTLAGVVAFNPHALDITFRDISLALAAVALVFEPTANKRA